MNETPPTTQAPTPVDKRPTILLYATPHRGGRSAMTEPEALMATGAAAVMVATGTVVWRKWWIDAIGVIAACLVVAAALLLTVAFTAAAGVVVSYIGMPSTTERQKAWRVLIIVYANVALIAAGVISLVTFPC